MPGRRGDANGKTEPDSYSDNGCSYSEKRDLIQTLADFRADIKILQEQIGDLRRVVWGAVAVIGTGFITALLALVYRGPHS